MTLKPYKTLLTRASDEFIINKSRFIGYGAPAASEEEALGFLADVRSAHKDASHHCYAYIIGANMGVMRYSDDGEPGGTAGMPMLEVLRHEGLVDVCCVVTRYFGGTLLGTGGLVRAYSRSAKLALDAAGLSQKRVWERVEIPCPYGLFEQVKNEIAAHDGMIQTTDFGADVQIGAIFPAAGTEAFLRRLTDLSSGRVTAVRAGQEYRDFPVSSTT